VNTITDGIMDPKLELVDRPVERLRQQIPKFYFVKTQAVTTAQVVI
jgi:hypothetical protein